MATPTTGFEKLHQTILSHAAKTLEQVAPQYVAAFRQALQQPNPSAALDQLSTLSIPHYFTKWRPICIALIDVKLQMHQVKTSLLLLGSPPPPFLRLGEWVTHHCDAWAVSTQGLLSRVEKLTKNTIRGLIRDHNPNWKNLEVDILQTVTTLKAQVAQIRDPVAHGGGAVEAITDDVLLKYTLSHAHLQGYVAVTDILESFAPLQAQFHHRLTASSNIAFAAIDNLSDRLTTQIQSLE